MKKMLLFIFMGIAVLKAQIPTSGLVAYYPFKGNINDMWQYGFNGTNYGAVLTSDRFGNPKSAYSFDGASYIALGDILDTVFCKPVAQFSISAWMKANSNAWQTNGLIVGKTAGGPGPYQWGLTASSSYTSGTIVWGVESDSTSQNYITKYANISTNQWIHLVCIFDGTLSVNNRVKFYVNTNPNVLLWGQAGSLGTSTTNTSYGINIGGHRRPGHTNLENTFIGSIDDIRIYNRVLSDAEILALYQEGPPNAPSSLTATAVSTTQANLSWTASTTGAPLLYRIYRSTTTGSSYVQIDSVNGSQTTYSNTGLSANTLYWYRVTAVNAMGESVPSNEISAKTFSAPSTISTTVPDTLILKGSMAEIPISISDLTDMNVLSFQFTVTFNTPNSILKAIDVVTTGTLSAATGWTVVPNISLPNQMIVGGFGSVPLSGSGQLLKLKFFVDSLGTPGQYSDLLFSNFIVNADSPAVVPANGRVRITNVVWGDADENGTVQAYDAALTLRDAIGLQALTAQGKLNADVDNNGAVQAFDAALILRRVIGLPNLQVRTLSKTSVVLGISAADVTNASVELRFSGVQPEDCIYALSFDATVAPINSRRTSIGVTVPSADYVQIVQRIDNEHYRIGIINPRGINSKDIKMAVANGSEIRITHLLLNTSTAADVTITGNTDVIPANSFNLAGAYPNPFNPTTRITFDTPEAQVVRIEVYTLSGAFVKTLHNGDIGAGRHETMWDGTNAFGERVASGQYFCRMTAGRYTKSIKLLLIK